jgi:hypothetical protein
MVQNGFTLSYPTRYTYDFLAVPSISRLFALLRKTMCVSVALTYVFAPRPLSTPPDKTATLSVFIGTPGQKRNA